MRQYLELLRHIRDNGTTKSDRTGVGTKSIFGAQIRFNLADGFPLVTTKRAPLRLIIHELLWFLQGGTNIEYLVQNDVHIWDEWAFERYCKEAGVTGLERYSDEWKQALAQFVERVKVDHDFAEAHGELGPVYGKQWVRWAAPDGSEVNQIAQAVEMIKNDPFSRRIIVSGWNVGELQELIKSKTFAPPSCHTVFQFMVIEDMLSCQLYQRSADMFLGVPFNIASYALLTMMMAQVTGLLPGEFIHTFGDAHIYLNHLEQVELQLSREPRPLPTMRLNPEAKDIFGFTYNDLTLEGYNPWPTIRAPIAV